MIKSNLGKSSKNSGEHLSNQHQFFQIVQFSSLLGLSISGLKWQGS